MAVGPLTRGGLAGPPGDGAKCSTTSNEYIKLLRFAYAWQLGEPDRALAGELDGE
ncbi:MAG TPA: hypothetical protein VME22_17345 [Solirubrobacteraceae bacterium]|nr:hypothetical protein [Solirubrobacteraceae bacterium]